MADVKWIKIVTDIFDDEKILLIESMPSPDSIIVIWFKLLCFAGKQNNSGVIMMNERIAYNDEMLATIFRRDVNTVRMALKIFEQFDMIRIFDGVITIPNWGKHQNFDKIEKKNEYMRNYMSEYRKKQRLLTDGAASENEESKDNCKDNCKTNSKSNVSCAEEELERDLEEEEKCIYAPVISFLNEKAGTKYKPTTEKTRKLIKARTAEGFTLEDFKAVIEKKCAEWIGTDMEKYLRPETLFGTKFEGYLNSNTRKDGKHGSNPGHTNSLGAQAGTFL